MKCPACNTENREDRAQCYHCQADLTILLIILNRAKQHYNNALEHAERGRTSEAIEDLKKAIELNSKHAPSHNVLGTLYAKKGLYQDAIAEWEAALSIDSTSKKAHEYIQQAQELSQTSALKKKLSMTKKIAGLFLLLFIVTLSYTVYFLYLDRLYLSGEKAMESGDYRESYTTFTRVMHNNLSTTMARGAKLAMSKIDMQLQTGLNNIEQKKQLKKYEEGIEICNRMLKMSLPDIWVQTAQKQKLSLLNAIIQQELEMVKDLYYKKGSYEKALAMISDLQSRYPEIIYIPEFVTESGKIQTDWMNKQIQEIDLLSKDKSFEKAIELANQLLEKKPAPEWQNKIQLIIANIKKQKTQAEYDLIVSSIKNKQYEIAYTRLTAIEGINLNSTQQVWLTQQLPNLKANLAGQYWKDVGSQVGFILDQKLDSESAKRIIQKINFIVIATPKVGYAAEALYYQGLAYEQLKQFNDAITAYDQIAKQYPKSTFIGNAAYHIAGCYEQLKQYEQAIAEYKKVMNQFPKRSYTWNPEARIKAIEKLIAPPKPITPSKPSPKK